jgi:hypothetical protein
MTSHRSLKKLALSTTTAALLLVAGFATQAPAGVAASDGRPGAAAAKVEPARTVEVLLDSRAELERLVGLGADLDAVRPAGQGAVAHAVVTPDQQAELERAGFRFGKVLYTEADWADRIAERDATIQAHRAQNKALRNKADLQPTATDVLKILRADYFESREGKFLSVEVKTSDGQAQDFDLTVHRDSGPGTEIGSGGTQALSRFVDADVYLYHRGMATVTTRPAYIEVRSPNGGVASARVSEWLPPGRPDRDRPLTGFVESYLTPVELYGRIKQLADEYPRLAEIVELPHQTNGYRRLAQTVFGTAAANRVAVDSLAWGHEGGNAITVELADPGAANAPLAVSVSGKAIRVALATDAAGVPVSTAAQVVAALNAGAGDLIRAYTYRGDAGAGVVAPAAATALSDFLNAPEDFPRAPQTVYMLRIGKHRDGSKLGVLAYAQEHAREWVPPLVSIETAERLLRNYATHRETRRLLDNLDIFIAPSINPDGGMYSFYDSNGQRKNMTNHCPSTGAADALGRNQWGVDNNRNYAAYTLWDGYFGASASCTSGTYAGPAPMTEPENKNLVWIADTHPNIRFSMNLHSSGDYFMWSPGAYQVPGREPAPRPELDEEAFFWGASESILTAIKGHRGTVVEPGRTGPIIDVLYSAAGNSGDHLWYLNDIYAWNFEVGQAGFQPEWAEAREQAMEYANGLYELIRVAYAFSRDRTDPRSSTDPRGGRYRAPVPVGFETSEPAAVFYTLDGSRPTFDSPQLRSTGVREGAESLLIERTTTIRWFSVDQAGNIENNYRPDGRHGGYNQATYVIRR